MSRILACVILIVSGAHALEVPETTTVPYWVMFADRGPGAPLSGGPAYRPYVDAVADIAKVRHVTNWHNGVSVDARYADLASLRALPFVSDVFPVGRYYPNPPVPVAARPAQDYGASTTQVQQLNADTLHALGYTGEGVVIGFLDSGFNNLDHPAFNHLHEDGRIVATWDFVNDTSALHPASHGTQVMSCAVAYAPGNLIGTAYNASVALARTENEAHERPIEMDHMVAGIEWLVDSVQVDIISASIGYNWFDPAWSEYDHNWEDLDGKTVLLTKTANEAAGKGTVVIVAAGNELGFQYTGPSTWRQGKILFPGDGDSVICVGGVDSTGSKWGGLNSGASIGPTYDGRIKPDVSALAQGVRFASGQSGYTSWHGTSFATPLIAGVAALLLEAHSEWDPHNIMTALRLSATQAVNPDTLIGWGVPDAYRAYRANHAIFGRAVDATNFEQDQREWASTGASGMSVRLYDAEENLVDTFPSDRKGWFLFEDLPDGDYHLRGYFESVETPSYDTTVTIPSPPRQILAILEPPDAIADDPSRPERFWAGTPFPNPANPSVSIDYRVNGLIPGQHIEMTVVNAVGQIVRSESVPASSAGYIMWNGTSGTGDPVASGIYFVRLSYSEHSLVRRLVLLR